MALNCGIFSKAIVKYCVFLHIMSANSLTWQATFYSPIPRHSATALQRMPTEWHWHALTLPLSVIQHTHAS